MTTDLDALIAEAREIDAVDLHEARNWAEDAESLCLSLADALESTLAELRQERERADELQRMFRECRRSRASLSRAEETIDRALAVTDNANIQGHHWMLRDTRTILTEYGRAKREQGDAS